MATNPERGEIWTVTLPNVGDCDGASVTEEQRVVVVQTNPANHNPRYPDTVVVRLSDRGSAVPFHVRVEPSDDSGLTIPHFVRCERIHTVAKTALEHRVGRLASRELAAVDLGIKLVLALE